MSDPHDTSQTELTAAFIRRQISYTLMDAGVDPNRAADVLDSPAFAQTAGRLIDAARRAQQHEGEGRGIAAILKDQASDPSRYLNPSHATPPSAEWLEDGALDAAIKAYWSKPINRDMGRGALSLAIRTYLAAARSAAHANGDAGVDHG